MGFGGVAVCMCVKINCEKSGLFFFSSFSFSVRTNTGRVYVGKRKVCGMGRRRVRAETRTLRGLFRSSSGLRRYSQKRGCFCVFCVFFCYPCVLILGVYGSKAQLLHD